MKDAKVKYLRCLDAYISLLISAQAPLLLMGSPEHEGAV